MTAKLFVTQDELKEWRDKKSFINISPTYRRVICFWCKKTTENSNPNEIYKWLDVCQFCSGDLRRGWKLAGCDFDTSTEVYTK